MRLVPESFSISELIADIESGTIALPEFQRSFIWKPPAIADLLRTIARHWPAGTFLLLAVDGAPDFAFTALKGAPPATEPKLLLLDGQQRSTAIYQAFTDQAPETYFINLSQVLGLGEFEDECLSYLKASKFRSTYPDVSAQAAAGVASVRTLWVDSEFQKWLRYFPEETQDDYLNLRERLLPGFKAYDIPALRLPSDVPLGAIAKIFETLNRTGVRLATFDLMVARLYPYDFKLRDMWNEARSAFDELTQFGVDDDDDGVEILKVIALAEHMRQREAGIRITVKGVRESDVLALGPDTVKAGWQPAVEAIVEAMRFVQSRCGVVRKNLLPSATLLLPLADALGPDRPRREGLQADLERWFWASSFAQTYSQGANTQAVADTRALRAWQADPSKVPEVITNYRLEPEVLLDGRRRNESLLRGLMCRAVVRDARDWVKDQRFRDLPDNLEIHHVIPDDYLGLHYRGDKDPVANFALLAESTNKSLGKTMPHDVLERPDVSREAIKTAWVDVTEFERRSDEEPAEHIERFLRGRSQELTAVIYSAVGIDPPAAAPIDGSD